MSSQEARSDTSSPAGTVLGLTSTKTAAARAATAGSGVNAMIITATAVETIKRMPIPLLPFAGGKYADGA
ncbi:hypothetical protein Are01nite_43310 [Actinoplanes regularis]|nr:hypothetical protein Are01nite_43310 [Actinoplanes regularis]